MGLKPYFDTVSIADAEHEWGREGRQVRRPAADSNEAIAVMWCWKRVKRTHQTSNFHLRSAVLHEGGGAVQQPSGLVLRSGQNCQFFFQYHLWLLLWQGWCTAIISQTGEKKELAFTCNNFPGIWLHGCLQSLLYMHRVVFILGGIRLLSVCIYHKFIFLCGRPNEPFVDHPWDCKESRRKRDPQFYKVTMIVTWRDIIIILFNNSVFVLYVYLDIRLCLTDAWV